MSSSAESPKRFAARRSFRNTLIFYVAFGGFGILGLVLIALGQRAGLVLVAFSAAFLALLLLVNFKPGWTYLVDGAGITIQRTFKHNRIPNESIAEVKLVSAGEAVALVHPDQVDEARSTRNMDIRSAFRAQRRVGETIGFSSVPVVFNETRAGGPLNIQDVGATTSGGFVVILTTDGKKYLLSPQEPEEFIRAFREVMSG